jgi:hypothetical protein
MAIVKIDKEFEARIAPLSPEEYDQLRKNIRREGCRDALRVWGTLLLDGHNRYHICKELGIDYGTTPIMLENRKEALLWIDQNQLGRRNLTDDQRAIVAGRVAIRVAEGRRKAAAYLAREMKANGKKKSVSDNVSGTERKDARAEQAKAAKVPERKVRAAMKLERSGEKGKALATKVLTGETTLTKAVREVRDEDPKPFRRNSHADLLAALRGLNSPVHLETVKALPPSDHVRHKILTAITAVEKILDGIKGML